jgi:hypothetical protein
MRLQKLHVFAECGGFCVPISSGDDAGAIRVALAWNLNSLAGLVPCSRPQACCPHPHGRELACTPGSLLAGRGITR